MDQWSKVSLCVCGYFLVYSIDTEDTIGTKNVNKNEFAHSKFLTGTEQNSNRNRKLKWIELLDTVKF